MKSVFHTNAANQSYVKDVPLKMLYNHCRTGNADMVQHLFHQHPHLLDHASAFDEFALHLACENGHLNVVKRLMQARPSINVLACDAYAFKAACARGHLEVAQHLHACVVAGVTGASGIPKVPNIPNHVYVNAFQEACGNGHLSVALYLLDLFVEHDIHVCVLNEDAFQAACKNGHLAVVQMLLKMNPKLDVAAHHGLALRLACQNRHRATVTWLLNDVQVHVHVLSKKGEYEKEDKKEDERLKKLESVFRQACYMGELEIAEMLLEAIPHINVFAKNDRAFYVACENRCLHVVNWLCVLYPNRYNYTLVQEDKSNTNTNTNNNATCLYVKKQYQIRPLVNNHAALCIHNVLRGAATNANANSTNEDACASCVAKENKKRNQVQLVMTRVATDGHAPVFVIFKKKTTNEEKKQKKQKKQEKKEQKAIKSRKAKQAK